MSPGQLLPGYIILFIHIVGATQENQVSPANEPSNEILTENFSGRGLGRARGRRGRGGLGWGRQNRFRGGFQE